MKRVTSVIAAVMMVALVVQVSSAGSDGKNILEFDTMFEVERTVRRHDEPGPRSTRRRAALADRARPGRAERQRRGGRVEGPVLLDGAARAGGSSGDEPDPGVPSDRQLPHDRQRSDRDQQRPTSSRSS